jgi:uncharacterized protein YggE
MLAMPQLFRAAFLAANLALAMPAAAQDATLDAGRITVTGTGTVEAAPDIATLMIGVTTQGATAADALTANSTAVAAVIARLTRAGIEAQDMQTSNLSLNPNWTGYDSSVASISGYIASNLLTVRVRKLDRLGSVLDAAVADGANTLNGLTFGLADPDPVLDKARIAAVADAQARAELLAEAAGVSLGRLVALQEAGGFMEPMPMFRAEVSATPLPVESGALGLTATVTLEYELLADPAP